MKQTALELPSFMKDPILIEEEISVTGKWVPKNKGGFFRKSEDSREMLQEWEDIHNEAKNHKGMLSTEINHAIGQDAVLVHHIFNNEDSLLSYFNQTASKHSAALHAVAQPDYHLIRGIKVSDKVRNAFKSKNVPSQSGDSLGRPA